MRCGWGHYDVSLQMAELWPAAGRAQGGALIVADGHRPRARAGARLSRDPPR
jgi:hypothetical protein